MIDPQTEIYALHEGAVTIVFGNKISNSTAENIRKFNTVLLNTPFPGFITAVPAYCTLSIFYKPAVVWNTKTPGFTAFEKVCHYLRNLHVSSENIQITPKKISIPVCYGGVFGPDLELLAAHTRLVTEEIIKLHSNTTYTVHMIGFLPGFAYLGGMDSRLSIPRKPRPSAKVPAGAVGIAGEQTGIYALDSPGGWQIIGQTPLKLFDACRDIPALLEAGSELVFQSITPEEFTELSQEQHAD